MRQLLSRFIHITVYIIKMFEFVPHEAAPAAVKEHHSALVVS